MQSSHQERTVILAQSVNSEHWRHLDQAENTAETHLSMGMLSWQARSSTANTSCPRAYTFLSALMTTGGLDTRLLPCNQEPQILDSWFVHTHRCFLPKANCNVAGPKAYQRSIGLEKESSFQRSKQHPSGFVDHSWVNRQARPGLQRKWTTVPQSRDEFACMHVKKPIS